MSSLTNRTRLVLISTVNYSTGFRVPSEELGRSFGSAEFLYYILMARRVLGRCSSMCET